MVFEQQSQICANTVISSCPDSTVNWDKYYSMLLLKLLQRIGLCENSICGRRIIHTLPAQIEQEGSSFSTQVRDTIYSQECLLRVEHCALCFINISSFISQSNPLAVGTVDPFYIWGNWDSRVRLLFAQGHYYKWWLPLKHSAHFSHSLPLKLK